MDVRPHYLQPEPCGVRKVVMTEEEMMIDRVVTWSSWTKDFTESNMVTPLEDGKESIPITDDYGFHSWSTSCLKTSRTVVNTNE